MKKFIIFLFVLLFNSLAIFSQTIYVSPNGTGDGLTTENPTNIANAIPKLKAGWTMYLLGGQYNMTTAINIQSPSGTSSAPIKFFAYQNEKPVLDFAGQTVKDYGIMVNANYWYLKGIEVCNNKGSGISVQGSYNTFEQCVFHHNAGVGLRIGFGHGSENNGSKAAYNKVINCDSYFNFDWQSSDIGGGADGYTCSLASGKGNEFIGCRAWRNSDDGWDFFECGFAVKVVNCWTWCNGITSDFVSIYKNKTGKTLTQVGDGNGFKMGGNHTTGGDGTCTRQSAGTHIFRNCIVFGLTGESGQGIAQNSHKDGAIIENCLSFSNKENYRFWVESVNAGKTFLFRNCISFDNKGRGDKFIAASEYQNNSWNLGLIGSVSDYLSLSENDAKASRGIDGSLPTTFGRLKSNSQFNDTGVLIPAYTNEGFTLDALTALNLGPQYNNGGQTEINNTIDPPSVFVTENKLIFSGKLDGIFVIYNLKGIVLKTYELNYSAVLEIDMSNFPKGLLLGTLKTNSNSQQFKILNR